MRSLILALMFCSSLFGQVQVESVDYIRAKAIVGLSTPQIFDDYVLVASNSDPKISDAAIITIKTDAKFVLVKARKTLFETVELAKMNEAGTQWLLVGSGRYAVEVTAFDPGIDWKQIEVVIGLIPPNPPNPPGPPTPPTPTPTPTPSPVVPSDGFNNLGQRVAAATIGLPKKAEMASLYRRAADRMMADPTATINGIVGDLVVNRTSLLGGDEKLYLAFIELINAQKVASWPMARVTYSEFLTAIAIGLEAK